MPSNMIYSRLWMVSFMIMIIMMMAFAIVVDGFTTVPPPQRRWTTTTRISPSSPKSSVLYMSDEISQESPEDTKERIKALITKHPVLLFMKGSKLFPQCGFSNTATQILTSFNIDFHTVDVLSDEKIRQGIKEYSNWPTIPQLYVAGEFLGGSDIMIEMYQSGELGEMIEKAKADMV